MTSASLFCSTYLRWYHLTDEPALRDVLIDAGERWPLRRQKGGYLASFVGPQSLFIDVMMNVGIVLWAANATGDKALRETALEHARTTAKYLVRADGGTAQEGIFDRTRASSCAKRRTRAGQRKVPDAAAWHGPVRLHRGGATDGEAEFLAVARRCADCYLRRAAATGLVPYWDFDLPPEAPHWWDSSAAPSPRVDYGPVGSRSDDRYRTAALTILDRLCSTSFWPSPGRTGGHSCCTSLPLPQGPGSG